MSHDTMQDLFNSIFHYREDTGELYWKVKTRNTYIGQIAGTLHQDKYMQVGYQGKIYRNHRVIYIMHHGDTDMIIDHIDGNTLNNKINNLRKCTPLQSAHNTGPVRNSKSKYKGVAWEERRRKWKVEIRNNGKKIWLGYYECEHTAAIKYNEAALKYHGEFARLNII